jgi:hypothetical protein
LPECQSEGTRYGWHNRRSRDNRFGVSAATDTAVIWNNYRKWLDDNRQHRCRESATDTVPTAFAPSAAIATSSATGPAAGTSAVEVGEASIHELCSHVMTMN